MSISSLHDDIFPSAYIKKSECFNLTRTVSKIAWLKSIRCVRTFLSTVCGGWVIARAYPHHISLTTGVWTSRPWLPVGPFPINCIIKKIVYIYIYIANKIQFISDEAIGSPRVSPLCSVNIGSHASNDALSSWSLIISIRSQIRNSGKAWMPILLIMSWLHWTEAHFKMLLTRPSTIWVRMTLRIFLFSCCLRCKAIFF